MENKHRPWSVDEDDEIRAAYGRNPKRPNLRALALVFGRGVTSVANRAKKLGLGTDRMEPSQQRLAAEMVAQGGSLAVVAEQLGATKMQVRHACKKHGVKPCERVAKQTRFSGRGPAATPANVLAAMQLVRNGMSMTQAALQRGIPLRRLVYYCNRDGVVSQFAKPAAFQGETT